MPNSKLSKTILPDPPKAKRASVPTHMSNPSAGGGGAKIGSTLGAANSSNSGRAPSGTVSAGGKKMAGSHTQPKKGSNYV